MDASSITAISGNKDEYLETHGPIPRLKVIQNMKED